MLRFTAFPIAALVGCATLPAFADTVCDHGAYVRWDLPGNPVVVDAPQDGAAVIGALPMVEDAEHGRMGAGCVDQRNPQRLCRDPRCAAL